LHLETTIETVVQSKPNKKSMPITELRDTEYKYSFAPIVNEGCEILILGSLPGDESLRRSEYYANPRNGFWKIMGALYADIPYCYAKRCEWLLENKVALWDVLNHGKRMGSLDNNITNGHPNDLTGMYTQYTNIKCVFFNGTKAQKDYVKHIGLDSSHSFSLLPSSSSARAMSFEGKVKEWERITQVL
jgi:hypoxanthine-DNA glycosylase